jgi:hypothetical protein
VQLGCLGAQRLVGAAAAAHAVVLRKRVEVPPLPRPRRKAIATKDVDDVVVAPLSPAIHPAEIIEVSGNELGRRLSFSSRSLAPPDGRGGSEPKATNQLAWTLLA